MTTRQQLDAVQEMDDVYMHMFDAIKEFFRYTRRHPEAAKQLEFFTDDAYYAKVAAALHRRIDHEVEYLHRNLD